MPSNESIWDLVVNASIVVQLVMLLLLVASVISWLIILQRSRVLSSARKAILVFEDRFWSGVDLSHLYQQMSRQSDTNSGMENIFRAGFKEFNRLRQKSGVHPDAVMDGCQRAMRVALSREEEELSKHVPFLATVGSTSPYIGLFGTVWGIMNSFIGLSSVKQATIATVAPGIAEALVATAIGLFAAIPAVIAYNRYNTHITALMNKFDMFADEFSSILHRTVHIESRESETVEVA